MKVKKPCAITQGEAPKVKKLLCIKVNEVEFLRLISKKWYVRIMQ